MSIRARKSAGKSLRDRVARERHAYVKTVEKGRDPVVLLERAAPGRLPELKPIRYGRMVQSPFTFLRGSAAVMAHDLAKTPDTGLRFQACGDCHVLNFGLYATPERKLVFDLNDFDETHPAPWEWDLKRLAASIVVASRDHSHTDRQARDAVLACARSYRTRMRAYAAMTPLDVWYDQIDVAALVREASGTRTRKYRERLASAARRRTVEQLFPKIAQSPGHTPRLVDQPPLLFHVAETDFEERVHKAPECVSPDPFRRPAGASRPLPSRGLRAQGGGHW